MLHQLSLSLSLCHLRETMPTKRILGALGTLLCSLGALGGRCYARLGKRDRRHVGRETGNTNIVIAFCVGGV